MVNVIELSEWKANSGGISFLKWVTEYFDKNDEKYKERLPAENRHNMQNKIENRLRLVFSIGIYYHPIPKGAKDISGYVSDVVNIKTRSEYYDAKESILTHIGEKTSAVFECLLKIIPDTKTLNKIKNNGWSVIDEAYRNELCERIRDAIDKEASFRHYADYSLCVVKAQMREKLDIPNETDEFDMIIERILHPNLYTAIFAYDNMTWYREALRMQKDFDDSEKISKLLNKFNSVIEEIRSKEPGIEDSLMQIMQS